MSLKVFSLSIPVALLSLLTTGNTAQAALLRSMDNYTEADLMKDIESGSFVEEFNLATYIGNDGTASSELEVNESLSYPLIAESSRLVKVSFFGIMKKKLILNYLLMAKRSPIRLVGK